MRVVVSGATGLIGAGLIQRLRSRGDEVLVLSRDPERAQSVLDIDAAAWNPLAGPAPAHALSGADAVVHLAGANVAQRWSAAVKRAIRESRERGTANLVAGLAAADPRPRVLASASAIGYYGPHGEEPIDESATAGEDFLAQVCVAWEREALAAGPLGTRVATLRTGVVLSRAGGALAKMLPPFRAGVGGPVAGGHQYVPWVHVDDVVGLYLAAIDDERFAGAFNVTAPAPVTNRTFSRALGRALHRPAVMPVPAFALRLLFGEMAQIVTSGANALPAGALALGYRFEHPELEAALAAALD
ncbi:MAG: TIGR01777 family oxidoreductase [Solirubrobacteraceae bacterium]|nr:MAG: TIGR01777 family protein [Solirubrobacterales bacterium]